MANQPILPLFDREPWQPGPQSQLRDRAPVPGTRQTFRPTAGPYMPQSMPTAPPLPVPVWEAEAHRYAVCSNLVLTVGAASVKQLDAPVTYRNLLALRNLDTVDTIAISFGNDASANSTFQIAPGAFVLFDTVVPQDDMYTFSITGGAALLAVTVSTIALPAIPPMGP